MPTTGSPGPGFFAPGPAQFYCDFSDFSPVILNLLEASSLLYGVTKAILDALQAKSFSLREMAADPGKPVDETLFTQLRE